REKVHLDTRRAQLNSMIAEDRRDARGGQSQERQRIEKLMSENARSRADAIVAVTRRVEAMTDAAHRLAVALAGSGGQRDLRRLNELRAEAERHREGIIAAQQAFDRATEAYNEAKVAARSCLDETRRVTEEMSDAERQAVREAQDQRRDISLDELEIELATCRQRLSLAANSGLSARVLEQYEERKMQLEDMDSSLHEMENSLRRVRRSKMTLRRSWEQPLADIVRQIGDAFTRMFDQIGCMGEVTLLRAGDGIVSHVSSGVDDPDSSTELGDSQRQQPRRNHRQSQAGGDAVAEDDEDYGRWGVEIRVAFRKDEAMQVLDNHRQSGGERAVSTILYLQAMQSLVAAPFRVVDEINQGMDARNERLIHEIVVDTACREGSAQYFLITPKLLPDLNYHPMMKVLCIFNGEWQPESFDFSKYISHANSRPQVAAASMVTRA
ncbi:Structural maintenance of chromosomes protein 5, partial [Coemansia guatemalensis]